MKAKIFFAAAIAILLAGCGKNSSATKAVNTVSNLVDTPLNYIGAVGQAQKYSENVIDVSYINQDIQMFNASEGHYPATLQEMIPDYLPKMPDMPLGYKLVYDTNSWTVKTVKVPIPPPQ